ncbi:MAG: hypothetical protein R3D69_16195 [Xanthobacteraceae bacterium]
MNNAGTSWGAPAVSHLLDGWNKVMNPNLMALFRHPIGACLRMLPRQRGGSHQPRLRRGLIAGNAKLGGNGRL